MGKLTEKQQLTARITHSVYRAKKMFPSTHIEYPRILAMSENILGMDYTNIPIPLMKAQALALEELVRSHYESANLN